MLFSWWATTQGAALQIHLFVHLCGAKLIPVCLLRTQTTTHHHNLYVSQREHFRIKSSK